MAQTIKVNKVDMSNRTEEVVELDLSEAKKLIENCGKWNCLVFDTKTHEVIREITPNVKEISIIIDVPVGGG